MTSVKILVFEILNQIKPIALDRKGLLYGAFDNEIHVIYIKTQKLVATLRVHSKPITSFALSNEPNGNVFVLATSKDLTVSYWVTNQLAKFNSGYWDMLLDNLRGFVCFFCAK